MEKAINGMGGLWIRMSGKILSADFSLDDLVNEMKEGRRDLGCIVAFIGIVRGDEGVKGMNVRVDNEKISDALESLCAETKRKFEIADVKIVLKKGYLSVGEKIDAILVSAAHRKDAFKACEFVVDKLKMGAVPIKDEEIREQN